MPQRLIQIFTEPKLEKILDSVIKRCDEEYHVIDSWSIRAGNDRIGHAFLVDSDASQPIIDMLQSITDQSEKSRVTVQSVEATLPKPEAHKEASRKNIKVKGIGHISREELYHDIEKGARLDSTFILLAILSSIVAAVGLLENNVAVVVGAMVIAPMLGPNLAFSFATAVGDLELLIRALKTTLVGFTLTLLLAITIGYYWPYGFESHELMSRTSVNYGSIILALSSGAAGVLSLVSGISMVLVGVMVAVALLPPAVTLGIMLGAGNLDAATGAGILLAVNVVSINLSAKLVFLLKGITPQKWYQKDRAKRTTAIYLGMWVIFLIALIAAIYFRQQLTIIG